MPINRPVALQESVQGLSEVLVVTFAALGQLLDTKEPFDRRIFGSILLDLAGSDLVKSQFGRELMREISSGLDSAQTRKSILSLVPTPPQSPDPTT